MFGYILVNPKTLSAPEKERYRAAYCGMCRQLRAYGAEGRATLSYDMTFIALLLNSVYALDEEHGTERCAMRPAPAHKYFISEASSYAADMNVLFAYYNDLDDWRDDHDRRAYARSKKLGAFVPAIIKKWPRQSRRAAECMETLTRMEDQNVLNPDEPANCFGELMGEILGWRGEGAAGAGLRRMGEALGRFLYLIDASNDLHEDIRRERYNPLIAQIDTDFEPLLAMLIGECTREFERLNPERDVHLLRNVLYSGVWMRYRKKRRERKGLLEQPEHTKMPAQLGQVQPERVQPGQVQPGQAQLGRAAQPDREGHAQPGCAAQPIADKSDEGGASDD